MTKEMPKIKTRNRSRTPESFRQEMKEKNPNIEIVGDYTNAKGKVECKCKKCQWVWFPTADRILRGAGCPKCAIRLNTIHRTKTTEQYRNELMEKKIQIIPIDDYKNANTKMKHQCLICKFVWSATPSSILSNNAGCPNCAVNKNSISKETFLQKLNESHPEILLFSDFTRASNRMDFLCTVCGNIFNAIGHNAIVQKQCCPYCYVNSCKMTKDEFISKFYNRNDEITVIGEFIDSLTPIDVSCNRCNYIWAVVPRFGVRGDIGCPKCAYEDRKITFELFKSRCDEKKFNLTFPNGYNGYMELITAKCNICNYQWETIPAQILNSVYGCPKCGHRMSGVGLRLSPIVYENRIELINNEIELLTPYIKSNEKVTARCKKCDHIWNVVAASLYRSGCPRCKSYHGEIQIANYLDAHNISYTTQKKYDDLLGIKGKMLSYDFFLCQYNLLVEYQGKQHYVPIKYFGGENQFKIQQEHDCRKRKYAISHNINLLEIRYDEDLVACLDSYFSTHTPIKKYTKISPKYRIK